MRDRRSFLLRAAASVSAAALSSALPVPVLARGAAGDLPEAAGLRAVPAGAAGAQDLSLGYYGPAVVVPRLRLMCATEAAVEAAVAWAAARAERQGAGQGAGFALRSGGHSFAGYCQNPELVIDTRGLNAIRVRDGGTRVSVGPGALMGDVYRALAPFGRSLPGASYGGVGMGGLTLGGGIGYGARAEGLLIDRLESLRLVLPDGRARTVDADTAPDLFWAARGGGGGRLGVATGFTFRTTPFAAGHSIDATVVVPLSEIAPLLYLWQYWSAGNPAHVTTHLQFYRLDEGRFLVHLMGRSQGARALLMEELRLLLRQTAPLPERDVASGSLSAIVDHLCPPTAGLGQVEFVSHTTLLDRPLSAEAVDGLVALLRRQPPEAVKLVFEALGGAASAPDPAATAWPHRKAFALLYMTGDIWDPEERAPRRRAVAEVADFLAPHVTGGGYVNYPEPGRAGYRAAYWGANAPRLAAIARKHDPARLFRHPQGW